LQYAVQKSDADGDGDFGEGWIMGAQISQPAHHVRVALQLLELGDFRVMGG